MRSLVRIGVVAMVALPFLPARAAADAALDSLVANERAFAAMSQSRGIKEAFLTYLAEDAVVFEPGPVSGRKVWEQRPATTASLRWEPAYAAVSSGGDFGYTTGPWEYQPPPDSTGAPAAPDRTRYGHFHSVWKRQKGGVWRVVADIGVTHPNPGRGGVGSVTFTAGPVLRVRTMMSGGVNLAKEDEHLSKAMRSGGPREALVAHAAEDLRLSTEGRFPAIGLGAAQARFDSLGGYFEYRTQGSMVAHSEDLGFSYGLAERFLSANGAPVDSSAYLNVWRRGAGRVWQLALSVMNPLRRR